MPVEVADSDRTCVPRRPAFRRSGDSRAVRVRLVTPGFVPPWGGAIGKEASHHRSLVRDLTRGTGKRRVSWRSLVISPAPRVVPARALPSRALPGRALPASGAADVRQVLCASNRAEQDVDGVAVASARLVAAEPVEVVGIACCDLAQRPALVAAEVEAKARTIGAQRTSRCPVGGTLCRRRWRSTSSVRLPVLSLGRVADKGVRPVQVRHPSLRALIERLRSVRMCLASEHAVRGSDHIRVGIRLHLENPIRISPLHRSMPARARRRHAGPATAVLLRPAPHRGSV